VPTLDHPPQPLLDRLGQELLHAVEDPDTRVQLAAPAFEDDGADDHVADDAGDLDIVLPNGVLANERTTERSA